MRQLRITPKITPRDNNSLDKYLQEVHKELLITVEEEIELAKKIKTGDQQALEKLVKANLRFVVSVAKQYQNQGIMLPDLINEGNLGLIKAAQKFDETRGFKFISYAVWWIRQTILQALAEQARMVRLPLNKVGALNKMNRTASKLEQELEREPTSYELSIVLETSDQDIKLLQQQTGRHISLDQPFSDDDDGTVGDLIKGEDSQSPDHGLYMESFKKELERALDMLSERERDIIKMFYGLSPYSPEGLKLEEIGEEFGLTRERVRQIKEKGIRRLKHSSRSKLLRQFL